MNIWTKVYLFGLIAGYFFYFVMFYLNSWRNPKGDFHIKETVSLRKALFADFLLISISALLWPIVCLLFFYNHLASSRRKAKKLKAEEQQTCPHFARPTRADAKPDSPWCGQQEQAGPAGLSVSSPRVDGSVDSQESGVEWITPKEARDRMHRDANLKLSLANAIVKQDTGMVRRLQGEGAITSSHDLPLPHLSSLILELWRIGRSPGYLSDQPGGDFDEQRQNIRARQIGEELCQIGGGDADLLIAAYYYIESQLGHHDARSLDLAWHMVGGGKWMA